MAALRLDAQRAGLTPDEIEAHLGAPPGTPVGDRATMELPPTHVLIALSAQRCAVSAVAYVHSRTESQLSADVEAWIATWATPARILMGAFTGTGGADKGGPGAPGRNNQEARGTVSDADAKARAAARGDRAATGAAIDAPRTSPQSPRSGQPPRPPGGMGMPGARELPPHVARYAGTRARITDMDAWDTPDRIDHLVGRMISTGFKVADAQMYALAMARASAAAKASAPDGDRANGRVIRPRRGQQ